MTPVAAERASHAARGGSPPSGRLRAAAPHALFVAVALAFCAPYLAPGKVLLPTGLHTIVPWIGEAGAPGDRPTNELMADGLVITLPSRAFNAQSLRAGDLPFWNPLIYSGYPHLAMIQNNALYPPSALLDLVDPVWSMAASIALHLAIAGSLMFAFLRRVGLSVGAAVVGGLAFELNGMFLVRASAPSYVFTGTWLPLLWSGAHAIAHRGGLRGGLAVAIGTALTVLGGHPQIAALSLVAAGAYLACEVGGGLADGGRRDGGASRGADGRDADMRGADGRDPRPAPAARLRPAEAIGALAAFALLVGLGIALAGFQVLPFAEFLGQSSRAVVPLGEVMASALPLPGLAQALLPDVFGHPVDGTYWFADLAPLLDGHARGDRAWAFNYSGENLFTGIAPLALAAIAIARPASPRRVAFFAGLALASLGILLGTPLLALAWRALPGFAYSRPDRVLFAYMAAVSVLAGFGAQAVLVRDPPGGRSAGASPAGPRWVATLAAVAAAAGITWLARPWVFDGARRAALRQWLAQAAEKTAALPVPLARQAAVAIAVAAATAAVAAAARRGRLAPATATAALALAIALPSCLFGWRFNPVQPVPRLGETATERAIVEHAGGRRLARLLAPGGPVLPANVVQLLGVGDVHGASAAGLSSYLTLMANADPAAVARMKYFPAFRDARLLDTRLLDVAGAGLLLTDRELPPPWRPLVREDGFAVWENPEAPAPFRVVTGDVALVADQGEARRRVLAPGFDPDRDVVVVARDPSAREDRALDAARAGGAGSGAPPARVTVERRDPQAIDLEVSAPAGGVLVTGEVDYPGWQSLIDGREVPTLLVNAAFRGVALPPGEHRVAFRYAARSFWIGLAVSAAAALCVAAIALIPRRRAAAR